MKNAILQICEKLRGYSSDTEYFEVQAIEKLEDGTYKVIVKDVSEGADNESDK